MTARASAVASDPVAAEAAEDAVLSGHTALAAVVSAFFASAGAYAGVLLSPVSILVAGVGVGARAFDGRLRQPGLGVRRPRGFRADEPIPEAARFAVPVGAAACLVALGYEGDAKLNRLLRPGVARARRAGASSRAALLERIRNAGASALTEAAFIRPLLHVAGPSQGGLLMPSDFRALSELDQEAAAVDCAGEELLVCPWSADAPPAKGLEPDLGVGHAICAVDARGVFAALAYRRVLDGILVDELELEAPRAAVPVRRGVTRVAPGSALPAPAPIGIRRGAAGAPEDARAHPAATRSAQEALSEPSLRIRRDPSTKTVRTESARPLS